MPALNRVQLIGYLGKDPESKFTPGGRKVTDFPMAVTSRWKSREGETKESTEWVNIEAWERLGEVCQEYLEKGSLVYVEGRLRTSRYEEEGEPRYFTRVVAQRIEFLSDSRDDENLFAEAHPAQEEETEPAGAS
jgi:single-strand DNA-binding protein